MNDVVKLRQQAVRARRLAAGVSDQQARDALIAYAEEADAHADAVEDRDASRPPPSRDR